MKKIRKKRLRRQKNKFKAGKSFEQNWKHRFLKKTEKRL